MKTLNWRFGFSCCIGPIVFLPTSYTITSYKHELGHYYQFQLYGIYYYLFVALPVIASWVIDKLFHRNWSKEEREFWHYHLRWEAEADCFGGVKRRYR